MPRVAKKVAPKRKVTRAASAISVKRASKSSPMGQSILQKLESQLAISKASLGVSSSYLNVVLGLVIVFVVGILVFNYFKGSQADLGPAQNTVAQQQPQEQPQKDVTPDNLPGTYTVKTGDTLYDISQSYYGDGFKYDQIASANNLANPDVLEVGQKLTIPKLAVASTGTYQVAQADTQGTGTSGTGNDIIWGPKITENTYTVVGGDWLSKIAIRAYGSNLSGDSLKEAYMKIAQANNIANPDLIYPGTVLAIPR